MKRWKCFAKRCEENATDHRLVEVFYGPGAFKYATCSNAEHFKKAGRARRRERKRKDDIK